MAFNAGSIVAKVKADISDFKKKIGDAKTQTKSLNTGIKDTAISFKKAAVAIGAFAGTAGLIKLAKNAVEASARMQQTSVSFRTIIGDAEKADEVLRSLTEFANVTPFETFDVTDAGKSLLAYGIQAEDVQKTLQKIGDVAAVANVPIGDMASIFGKIRSGGVVFTEDLNQLADRGIPILDVLAEKFNTTALGVREMASKGKILASDMEEAFEVMSSQGGFAFEGMKAQSETLNGRLSTLTGKFQLLMVQIGEKLMPVVEPVINLLITIIDRLSMAMDGEGGLTTSIQNLWNKFAEAFPRIAEIISLTFVFIQMILDQMREFWDKWGETITGIVQTVFNMIWSIIKTWMDFVITVVLTGLKIITGDWSGAMDEIGGFAQRMKDRVLGIFTGLLQKAQEIFDNIRKKIAEALNMDKKNSPSINDRLKMIREGVQDTFTDIGFDGNPSQGISQGLAVAGSGLGGITINLPNAVISSKQDASIVGEAMGDAIIKKLTRSVKF